MTHGSVAGCGPIVGVLGSCDHPCGDDSGAFACLREGGVGDGKVFHLDQTFNGVTHTSEGVCGRGLDHVLTRTGEVHAWQKKDPFQGRVVCGDVFNRPHGAIGQFPSHINGLRSDVLHDETCVTLCTNGGVAGRPNQLRLGTDIHLEVEGVVT